MGNLRHSQHWTQDTERRQTKQSKAQKTKQMSKYPGVNPRWSRRL